MIGIKRQRAKYVFGDFFSTNLACLLFNIVRYYFDSQIIAAALPAGLEFGISAAKQQGLDISFLSGALTNEELLSDLNVVVEIAKNAVAFGAIDYLVEGNIENIDVNYIVNIVSLNDSICTHASQLNINIQFLEKNLCNRWLVYIVLIWKSKPKISAYNIVCLIMIFCTFYIPLLMN